MKALLLAGLIILNLNTALATEEYEQDGTAPELSAICFQNGNEGNTIEIFVAEKENFFKFIKPGLKMMVAISAQNQDILDARISQVKNDVLTISLSNGQTLKMNQNNGKAVLGSKRFRCSNPLGF